MGLGMNRKKTGVFGEKIVEEYFYSKGCDIIAKNFRFSKSPYACEIDLVVYHEPTESLWLCEVKTRKPKSEFEILSFKQYQRLQNSLYLFKKYMKNPRALEFYERDSLDQLFGHMDGLEIRRIRLLLLKVDSLSHKIELFQPTW
jgi:Holliday junction resolvase-like predicted endonuclease